MREPIIDKRLFVTHKDCDWLVPEGEECEICGEIHVDEKKQYDLED